MTTTYTATFSSKGQLTFPVALRRKLGIKPGYQVTIEPHPTNQNEHILKISNNLEVVERLSGSLHIPGIKYIPIKKAREIAGRALAKKYGLTPRH